MFNVENSVSLRRCGSSWNRYHDPSSTQPPHLQAFLLHPFFCDQNTWDPPPLHTLRSALMVLLSGGTTAGLWNFTIPRDWGGWLVGTVSDPTFEDICPQSLQPWPAGHWDPTLVADWSPISNHSCDVAAAFSVSPVLSHSSELCHRHALISIVVV